LFSLTRLKTGRGLLLAILSDLLSWSEDVFSVFNCMLFLLMFDFIFVIDNCFIICKVCEWISARSQK